MKRILHIVGGMYPGGLENFIMNIFRNLNRDEVVFDVITHAIREGDYCNEIEKLGGKVYLAPRKSKHPVKNYLEIKRIVKEGGYDVVVRHSDAFYSVLDLMAAKAGGAKRLIYQSHSSSTTHVNIHKLFRFLFGNVPTDRFACSDNAGKWMYGKRDYVIVKNAIDIKKYIFDNNKREALRKEWKLEGKKIYAHVGIYSPVKNHCFMIRFFNEISKLDNDAVLLLIGEGSERQNMEALIKELSLEKKVILTGVRYDVEDLLQMADLFLFPSIYEGLPLSLIEAQSSGLRCLVSDVITDEVIVTDLVTKMSLDDSLSMWASKAVELSAGYERTNRYDEVAARGYDVEKLAKWYSEL